MALAGELVLTRNALVQSVASGSKDAISGTAQRIDALTSELQDGIMLTRMQPIGSAFGRFRRVVRDLARGLAQGPSVAHAITKRSLHAEWDMSVNDAIAAEAEAQALCMQTEDFARAYRAFVDKKTPEFEGN